MQNKKENTVSQCLDYTSVVFNMYSDGIVTFLLLSIIYIDDMENDDVYVRCDSLLFFSLN